jgi:hypothetical protein
MNQKYSRPIWLQDTKPDWAIQRIKYATYLKARVGWHGLTSSEYLNEGVLLITGTDFENGRINWEICYRVSEERYQQDPYIQINDTSSFFSCSYYNYSIKYKSRYENSYLLK